MYKIFITLLILIIFSCKSKEKKEEDTYQIPAKQNSKTSIVKNDGFKNGKKIYNNICVTCHLPTGKGIPGTYPPLDGSNWLTDKREESIHAVKYGLKGPISVNDKDYDNVMTPLGLEDQEVADVLNYVMNSWGNSIDEKVTVKEVTSIKE